MNRGIKAIANNAIFEKRKLSITDYKSKRLHNSIVILLICKAALFYIPRKIWKSSEGGLMQTFGRTGITSFLTRKEPGQEDAGVVEDDIKKVSHYFINTLHHNTGYFLMVN